MFIIAFVFYSVFCAVTTWGVTEMNGLRISVDQKSKTEVKKLYFNFFSAVFPIHSFYCNFLLFHSISYDVFT